MSDFTKKGKRCALTLYTVPGIAGMLGRTNKAIYEAIQKNGVAASGSINGDRPGYTLEDAEMISKLLRRPNATQPA